MDRVSRRPDSSETRPARKHWRQLWVCCSQSLAVSGKQPSCGCVAVKAWLCQGSSQAVGVLQSKLGYVREAAKLWVCCSQSLAVSGKQPSCGCVAVKAWLCQGSSQAVGVLQSKLGCVREAAKLWVCCSQSLAVSGNQPSCRCVAVKAGVMEPAWTATQPQLGCFPDTEPTVEADASWLLTHGAQAWIPREIPIDRSGGNLPHKAGIDRMNSPYMLLGTMT